MSDLLIQHASWQGELVKPIDRRLKSGNKCGCICFGCGESLILRRGKKRRHHFAHQAATICDTKSMIHNIVQAWVAQELPGKAFALPPHPEMDSPCEFLVYNDKTQTEYADGNRRYDVKLEGMFLYDFGIGDFNQDLGMKRNVMWMQKKTAELRNEQRPTLKEQFRQSGLPKSWEKDYLKNQPPNVVIHPRILALLERDELKYTTYKGGLRSDKLDHIMIEVEYSHAKNDEFKSQVKEERRYVLEVNAERFYGDGRDLSPSKLIQNSNWVWPVKNLSEEQMPLFEEP